MRGVLTELGLDAGKPLPAEASGTGGPFVPVRAAAGQCTPFEKRLQRISVARAHVERLNRTMQNVPVRQPLPGELDQSSGFGVRVDPFFRRPAMHTGLDFRGDSGDPVRATAAGTVSHAGWQGGYGKLVEIDHGNGLATRYGHLSEIGVRVGQYIKIGQMVGRIGSTGRSTGPHLHYETRVEGDPVDPQKFLRRRRQSSGMRFVTQLRPRYSTFTPAALTTFAHFSVSSAIVLPKSSGVPGVSVPPSSASFGFDLRIGEREIDLAVEFVDHRARRPLRHAKPKPRTGFIARQRNPPTPEHPAALRTALPSSPPARAICRRGCARSTMACCRT